jgi:hypothetical protein
MSDQSTTAAAGLTKFTVPDIQSCHAQITSAAPDGFGYHNRAALKWNLPKHKRKC